MIKKEILLGSFALLSSLICKLNAQTQSAPYNNSFGGSYNFRSLDSNAKYNNAFGAYALSNGTGSAPSGILSGAYNNAFGGNSLLFNTTGTANSAFGYRAMYNNLTGSYNTAIGMDALKENVSGYHNIAIGNQALINNNPNTGDPNIDGYNVAIGYYAGRYNMSGIGNVFIGAGVAQNETGSNKLYIHNNSSSSPLLYGDFLTRNLKFNGDTEINANSSNTSGLKFSDLTSSSPALANSSMKVLSLDSDGKVVLVNDIVGTGSATSISAGTNINVEGNPVSGYTISSPYQTLSVNGHNLTISNGNTVTLPMTINTDEQMLSINNNQLTISNGNTVNLPNYDEVDGSINNELQTLSQMPIQNTGTEISLSNGGGSVFIDGSETKIIAGSNVSVSGNGTIANPYQVSAIINENNQCNIYTCDGIIDTSEDGLIGVRTVTMGENNLVFNNSGTSDATRGKIYIGALPLFGPPATLQNYNLFVEKGILTEKVKVALRSSANWADYVFADNYKLMPLKDVEAFVKENKHLPGVTSAENLAKEGLDLGQMQAKQMEKIEELTLYVIGQNKTIEKQSKEIEDLKAMVNALVNKMK